MNNETCKWYVSIEQPECGDKAVAKVRVKGRVTDATVPLCSFHKSVHDENFARMRNSRKGKTTSK